MRQSAVGQAALLLLVQAERQACVRQDDYLHAGAAVSSVGRDATTPTIIPR